ncbi:Fe-S protein assembly co-chaperone HscB [Mucisphaera sp.]|uniref:Fe-S protein assembly co-chaperone HscB n=1 Tax=Mucisphaera sp. TaxID=2913024 RepID=UPI003D0EFA90
MDNPFHTLGLPPSFDLDHATIEATYLTLAAQTHPDRFTDPIEQAEAAEQASAINLARDTLKDPEKRAKALLALRGESDPQNQDSLPPDFLMDVMEIRERLDSAIEANNLSELADLREWAQTTRENHLKTLANQFANDAPSRQIRMELNTLRYIQRMLDQMPG